MNEPAKGGELFIVDNSDADWKVLRYLKEWTEIAKSFDIATGHFEIGGLLALEGDWQKLEKIRILMGDEVSIRTQKAFQEFLKRVGKALDESIEKEKEKNEFLAGAPAIVEALAQKKNRVPRLRQSKVSRQGIHHSRENGGRWLGGSGRL